MAESRELRPFLLILELIQLMLRKIIQSFLENVVKGHRIKKKNYSVGKRKQALLSDIPMILSS